MRDRESTQTGIRVELFVNDVSRSTAFYVQVLGFEVLRADPGGYVSIARPGATIGLNAMSGLPDDHPIKSKAAERMGLGVELVLLVADVNGMHRAAAQVAGANLSALKRQIWGLTDFRIQDPDGYYVRVSGLSEPE